jgi:hypothetical protein
MKRALRATLFLTAALGGVTAIRHVATADAPYAGSSFHQVWGQVASDPYATPHYAVTLGSFFGFLDDYLTDDSRRTLSDRDDLLPHFQKLLHPNGICLAGTWTITAETPFTGYFKTGSHALILARASTALTATTQGSYRAFGFAGKIFPTTDAEATVPTANFFTIEDLGGTLRDHYLDALNTNDIINITPTPTFVENGAVAAAVTDSFFTADQTTSIAQVTLRQLYPISEAGEADPSTAVTPMWLMITGSPDVPRVDAADFRDELNLAHYPGGLRFDIRVATVGTRTGAKQWQTIGTIDVTASVVSDSCDHRLHFSHPRFRQ